MMHSFVALIVASLLSVVISECPNACSSHGRCGAYDMCQCYRNWMANDCSERICQFGLAHVDTPKGDLDSSGTIESPGGATGFATVGTGTISVENSFMYPYGTTEKYPDTRDSRSIGAKDKASGDYIKETGHFPMECSNKGLCDRAAGTCSCFPGYSGSACQYASCPTSSTGVCSGHGVCMDAKALALADNGNPYRLWDQHKTLGCKCDAGYSGADCSERVCKYGADPLYHDDIRNVRHPTFTYQINSVATNNALKGNYSIIFYDRSGEDWETAPIDIAATCPQVIAALEALPNKVVPPGSVLCFAHIINAAAAEATTTASLPVPGPNYPTILTTGTAIDFKVFSKYTISFTGNLGKLKQPELNLYLDGSRPTLTSTEATSTLSTSVYINGFGPEDQDFAPDLCEGVKVKLDTKTFTTPSVSVNILKIASDADKIALKKCLGDSNGKNSDNTEVYNWDYGSGASGDGSPHLIKLIDATQDLDATVYGTTGVSNTFDASKQKLSSTKLCRDGSASCNSVNPPGFYAVIYWDGDGALDSEFVVVSTPQAIYSNAVEFNVYTSQSWLKKTTQEVYNFGGIDATLPTNAEATDAAVVKSVRADAYSNVVYTVNDLSCEGGLVTGDGNPCLEKGDYIMIFDIFTNAATSNLGDNPEFLNIYQIQKIEKTPPKVNGGRRFKITLDYGVNKNYFTDKAPYIYKLTTVNTYKYVSQCSGRGVCDTALGTCDCFKGYTDDNCDTQSALVN